MLQILKKWISRNFKIVFFIYTGFALFLTFANPIIFSYFMTYHDIIFHLHFKILSVRFKKSESWDEVQLIRIITKTVMIQHCNAKFNKFQQKVTIPILWGVGVKCWFLLNAVFSRPSWNLLPRKNGIKLFLFHSDASENVIKGFCWVSVTYFEVLEFIAIKL